MELSRFGLELFQLLVGLDGTPIDLRLGFCQDAAVEFSIVSCQLVGEVFALILNNYLGVCDGLTY
jgi:hypothetical protein